MRAKAKKTLIGWAVIIGFLVFIYVFFHLKVIALPFISGAMIAYLLLPLVKWFEQRRIPLPIAVLILYGAILLLLVITVFWGWPRLAEEFAVLTSQLPAYWDKLSHWGQGMMENFQRLHLPNSLLEGLNEGVKSFETALRDWGKQRTDAVLNLISNLFSLFLAPVLAYYMLRDRKSISRMLAAWLPPKIRAHCFYLAREIDQAIKQFVQGYLLVSLFVGAAVAIALSILGMKYALVIGIFAGIMDLIPYFGPVLGAIPAVVLGLAESESMALLVIIVFILVQQLENILTPKIIGEKTGMHPLLIIFAVLLGGYWFGILGMVFGMPVVAIIKIIVSFIYSRIVAWQEE